MLGLMDSGVLIACNSHSNCIQTKDISMKIMTYAQFLLLTSCTFILEVSLGAYFEDIFRVIDKLDTFIDF